MVRMSDERLVAFVDGELDAVAAAEVKAVLRTDPALQADVAALTQSGQLARQAYDDVLNQEVPERLLELFEDPQSSNVVSLDQARGRLARFGAPAAMALAASIALVIGFTGGQQLGHAPSSLAELDSAVGQILEVTPGYETVVASVGEVTPVLTFQRADGHYCREYELDGSDTTVLRGVACRVDGRWTTQLTAHLERGGAAPVGGDYAPASGAATDLFDQALDSLMAAPALGAIAEADALAKNWTE